MGLCECGCLGEVKKGRRFIYGHHSKLNRKANEVLELHDCECGCGLKCKKRFISGHNGRVKNGGKKENDHKGTVSKKCICGCGKNTKLGGEWAQGHRKRGVGGYREDKLEIRSCLCGCGLRTKPGNIYIKNHNSGHGKQLQKVKQIGLNNKGKKRTEEQKLEMSEHRLNWYKTEEGLQYKKRLSEESRGKGNYFYGQQCTDEEKKKRSDRGKQFCTNPENRKKLAQRLKDFYETDDGKQAIKRRLEYCSKRFKGEGNPMYGKPSHVKNGHHKGISGWFNGLLFRSSCELNFLMTNHGTKWISAESLEFRVWYVNDAGNKMCHFPDFFGENTLVEVKTIGWRSNPICSGNVEKKQEAAKVLCEEKGWNYQFVEIASISKLVVFKMRWYGILELTKCWEDKYQEWLSKQKSAF